MSSEAEPMPTTGGAPPKRRLRNYLLDARFQLKYTGMVVAVTVLVAAGLGYLAYGYSTGMTEMLTMQRGAEAATLSDELQRQFEEEAKEEDLRVLLSIIGGIAVLALSLGLTGILVTHRVVGPAYKLKLLLGHIERGSLKERGGFRKGDELQDVGDAFKRMVVSLRTQREDELAELARAIDKAKAASVDATVIADLEALRDRLERALQS